MQSLDDFGRLIEAELATAEHPSHGPTDVASFVEEIEQRHAAFRDLAAHLMESVIRPRVEKLAGYFENAHITNTTDPLRCACHFGYSQRCPANIRLEICLSHDEHVREFLVSWEMQIIPKLVEYDPYDDLTMRLDALIEADVASWIERKLLDFVRTYVRLKRDTRDQRRVPVTDPVCGMSMNRSDMQERLNHHGHLYFFCSPRCKEQFATEPARYVTMAIH